MGAASPSGLPIPARLAHPSSMGTKSRETIYGSSIRASAERAREARKQADRIACEAWNLRMLGYGGPAHPSNRFWRCHAAPGTGDFNAVFVEQKERHGLCLLSATRGTFNEQQRHQIRKAWITLKAESVAELPGTPRPE